MDRSQSEDGLTSLVEWMDNWFFVVSNITLVLMLLVILVDVGLRYVRNNHYTT